MFCTFIATGGCYSTSRDVTRLIRRVISAQYHSNTAKSKLHLLPCVVDLLYNKSPHEVESLQQIYRRK